MRKILHRVVVKFEQIFFVDLATHDSTINPQQNPIFVPEFNTKISTD